MFQSVKITLKILQFKTQLELHWKTKELSAGRRTDVNVSTGTEELVLKYYAE